MRASHSDTGISLHKRVLYRAKWQYGTSNTVIVINCLRFFNIYSICIYTILTRNTESIKLPTTRYPFFCCLFKFFILHFVAVKVFIFAQRSKHKQFYGCTSLVLISSPIGMEAILLSLEQIFNLIKYQINRWRIVANTIYFVQSQKRKTKEKPK